MGDPRHVLGVVRPQAIRGVADASNKGRLGPSTAEGPFPMETTYTWSAEGEKTRMTLRNRGEPTGFAGVVAPVMAMMMRRANQADLAKLKALLESR